MKKILLLVGLATMLVAANCPDKSKMYSEGYNAITKELKEYKVDPENPGLKKVYISAFANSVCKNSCTAIVWGESKSPSDKKYNSCIDICLNGAQDAYAGSKPKMQLCE